MVGNSSSGLAEAPSFKIGTINIGDRQKGRIMANSVIDCNSDINSINNAFQLLYSSNFKNILLNSTNPYGDGGASEKIKDIIKGVNLDGILKKSFYDISKKR
jgi:GDP/UDP-N,N'-diacetylbacillosamine 2-epimerase (hydrolysing)